jgi:hypothetical protein
MNGDEKPSGVTGNWQYNPDPQSAGSPAEQAPSPEPTPAPETAPAPIAALQNTAPMPVLEAHPEISWTAAEFVHHEKTPLWYLALIACTIVLAAAVLLISHDKVSTALIVIIGIIFGITAGRQPRSLQYLLDAKGITINRAFRPYSDFKSFAIIQEAEATGIVFFPLGRFTLPLSVYVGLNETDEVVTKLTDYLPNDQTHGHDALDRFVQRIHF